MPADYLCRCLHDVHQVRLERDRILKPSRRSFGESAKDSLTFGFQPAARYANASVALYLPDLVYGMALCESKTPGSSRVLLSVTTRRWKTCATIMHNVRIRCSRVTQGKFVEINDFTERALDNFSIKKSHY